MRVVRLAMLIAAGAMMSFSAQALEVENRMEAGVEYRFISGDGDAAPAIYADYEIDLPEPISLVLGGGYYSGDYDFKGYGGSYDSLWIEALLRVCWDVDQWRPYLGAGGAHYFNSFDNLEIRDKLGLIVEAGTFLQVSDNISSNMALRYSTLQPHHVKPEIGTMDLDAITVRAGLVFDF